MNLLHADYVKTVATGGSLSSADEYELIEGPNCNLKSTKHLLNHILADNPSPDEVIQIGVGYEFRATLAAATLEDLATFCNGTYSTSYSEDQTVQTLSEYDIEFAIVETDATRTIFTLTNMIWNGDVDWAFELNKRFYLPIMAQSTKRSTLTIAAEVV